MLTATAVASTVAAKTPARPSDTPDGHLLVTFSGTGQGQYAWNTPEDTVGDAKGRCSAASISYSTVDTYHFAWSAKLAFPQRSDATVTQYTASGTDVTNQQQGSCKNGFGNLVGGDAFQCTVTWQPLQPSDPGYPTVSMSGPVSDLQVKTGGSIMQSSAVTPSSCAGENFGQSVDSLTYEGLTGAVGFSAAQLERKHTLTKAVHSYVALGCGSVTCYYETCADNGPLEQVPTTCNDGQSLTGELKVQLVR